jgi:hypothetical protein
MQCAIAAHLPTLRLQVAGVRATVCIMHTTQVQSELSASDGRKLLGSLALCAQRVMWLL